MSVDVAARDEDLRPMEDRELLEEVVMALVDAPDKVRVEETFMGADSRFKVHVAPEDRRHVIGKEGRTVTLLRKLFGVIAARQNKKTFIDLAETEEERRAHLSGRHREERPNGHSDKR